MIFVIRSRWGLRLALLAAAALITLGTTGLGLVVTTWHADGPVGRVPGVSGAVALTFDDGPDPRNTPAILDILAKYGAHATFFSVGKEVENFPDITRRAVAEGHEIGSHSYSHARLTTLSVDRFAEELDRSEEAVMKAGGRKPVCFRPPYGALTPGAMKILAERGYYVVLWVCESNDWVRISEAQIVSRVLTNVRPGAIVLMHDGGGPRPRTVGALPKIIEGLLEQGYRCVTVSELIKLAEER